MTAMINLGRRAKAAAQTLAVTPTQDKNRALEAITAALATHQASILAANADDIAEAEAGGLTDALIDRLRLTPDRLQAIAAGVQQVAGLPDPVGEEFDVRTLPNGLRVRRRRTPLGVLGVIYEARPNVTVDIAALALKSGNATIMRGGSETLRSNLALIAAICDGLAAAGLPTDSVSYVDKTDRSLVLDMLRLHTHIDMIIPRGGAGLHTFCRENATVPVITGGIGVCHLYVDASADLDAAVGVIHNAKVQRPSVCNARDTLLVHPVVAGTLIPRVVERLGADGVTFRGDARSTALADGIEPAGPEDWDRESLSQELGIRVVDGLEEAVGHIREHSTGHSDGILTTDAQHAEHFINVVDSAAV
ncbi:MAG: glutamate-5-semialdehyde dehydrogenase [Anaerolineae bacterium]